MGSMSDSGYMLYYQVLGSLLLVLAILFLVAYGLKRWSRFFTATGPGDRMQVLSRLPLGPRHHVVLIQVQEQQLLLGVSPDGIRLLTSVEKPTEPQEQQAAPQPKSESPPRFQAILNRFIGPRT
jgi:flagellar protein FliO/FliZ